MLENLRQKERWHLCESKKTVTDILALNFMGKENEGLQI